MINQGKMVRFLLAIMIIVALFITFLRSPQVGRILYPYFYREVIERYAASYGVDPLLVAAVIRVESKFDQNAVSRRGALGLMQLMPATANWIAPQLGITVLTEEMILTSEINIRLGTWYLANLATEFNHNRELILAAYNAGRGQVSGWLAEGVWSGSYEDVADIPFLETRNYVSKVRAAYNRYQALY
ncbi:MAG: Soluble lytic murein transglycosylase [Dehalococcoidia bacterium]|nr:Soluble lytic murein transglycosylase [Bacillota bacterium]